MHIDRMKKLLQALREYPKDRPFLMSCWSHCAFGAYCHREDLQEEFMMRGDQPYFVSPRAPVLGTFDVAAAHFGITTVQAEALFSGYGCGKAYTPTQAALYVERVIEIAEAIEEVTAPNYQGDPKHGDPRLHETGDPFVGPRVCDWARPAPKNTSHERHLEIHQRARVAGLFGPAADQR